jgi:4-hydroxybenzoate polyprenyltransferase
LGCDKLIDYLKMLRIQDWIRFYLFIPLAGAVMGGGESHQILLVSIIYFFLISYAFVVNNYFDVDIDKLHLRKMGHNKNPLANGSVSKRGVLVLMLLQIIFALLCSLYLSRIGSAFMLLNILLFTAYSARHIRLKERFGWDIVTHGQMFGMVPFMTGFLLCQTALPVEILSVSLLFFMIACEALIAHQVTDYVEDVKATTTTVTQIGQKKGLLLLGAFAGLSLLMLAIVAYQYQIPSWLIAALAIYLMAYPAYSCRGVFCDIGYCACAE